MINPKQVQEIVDKTSRICGHELVFIDTNEKIIAAFNQKRIGTQHNGIANVLFNREILISSDEEAKKNGVLGGMVLPIVVDEEVIGAIGITGQPEEIRKYGEMVKHQVEMMYMQVILFEASKTRDDIKNTFIQELLCLNSNGTPDVRLIRNLGTFLDYDINAPYIIILISVNNDHAAVANRIDLILQKKVLTELEKALDGTEDLITKISNERFIILKKLSDGDIKSARLKMFTEKVRTEVLEKHYTKYHITIGDYYPGILGMRDSFYDAEKALTLVTKMDYQKGVFYLDEFHVARILHDVSRTTRTNILNHSGYQRMLDPDMKWLLHTANVFIENDLNLSKSAAKLHIHRNSLHYRLTKIQELTGFNLRKLKNAFDFYLIFKLADFD